MKYSTGIKWHWIFTPHSFSVTDTFSRTVFTFILSFSHSSTEDAPRDTASIAIVPEPLKRSSQDFPVRSPSIANTDSRILSIAGRITPSGHFIILPFSFPPVILIFPYLVMNFCVSVRSVTSRCRRVQDLCSLRRSRMPFFRLRHVLKEVLRCQSVFLKSGWKNCILRQA